MKHSQLNMTDNNLCFIDQNDIVSHNFTGYWFVGTRTCDEKLPPKAANHNDCCKNKQINLFKFFLYPRANLYWDAARPTRPKMAVKNTDGRDKIKRLRLQPMYCCINALVTVWVVKVATSLSVSFTLRSRHKVTRLK